MHEELTNLIKEKSGEGNGASTQNFSKSTSPSKTCAPVHISDNNTGLVASEVVNDLEIYKKDLKSCGGDVEKMYENLDDENLIVDRFNTLITARPFNSINLTNNRHHCRLKTNLQAKTLGCKDGSSANSNATKTQHQPINIEPMLTMSSSTSCIAAANNEIVPSIKYSICNRLKSMAAAAAVSHQKPLLSSIFVVSNPTSSSIIHKGYKALYLYEKRIS